MKKIFKNISMISLTLSASMVWGQSTTAELLEELQLTTDTPLMELNVGQFVTIVQKLPQIKGICADFTGFGYGTAFGAGYTTSINNIDFSIYYSGGARVSDFSTYPGDYFLEMVEDGAITIDLPVTASEVVLSVIQAATMPNEISYFDDTYAQIGSSIYTSQYNNLDSIILTDNAGKIKTISLKNPELYIKEVCYK